ncbi:hypothetical protein L484_021666 [Morus notabilis]|uniref:TOD1/MUCI70 glycosyltransferase-like domain-containing protein n=1 Tax=Morus notabilis TaxID=981085 RepID=W9SV96_9ROSA|nr:uncharacterized protein LOC21404516 [Morus notabilis]EXC29358.1 hypothetical protein L484_021666 [Morus notabilis]
MGKAASTPPLFFQSKLLCFSLLYLSSSLFFSLYISLSKTKCLVRYSSFEPLQTPLFSYPSSYGEHKYAIPTVRSTCSSPVFFSDYGTVVKKIEDLCRTSSSSVLRYLEGNYDTFGGNFTAHQRFSYFDHQNDTTRIPCGFLKEFPITDSDRIAMENCKGVVVVSAIFNDHDKIRQPRGLGSKTLQSVCFYMFVDDITLKGLKNHKLLSEKSRENSIGAWRIVRVSSKNLYENPAMNGVIPKYLVHRLFPNAKFSIWIDAKLQLMVDPLLLIHALVVSQKADVAISKHPFYVHTMEEAIATARWKKWWDVDALRRQMETYCEYGLQPWNPNKLPYTSDVPDSALILRKHDLESNLFSCLLFNELEGFNPRDQLAFAYVRDNMRPKPKVNMFEVEVFERIAVEFRHNLNPGGGTKGSQTRRTKRASSDSRFVNGSCQKYLLEMWGESHD